MVLAVAAAVCVALVLLAVGRDSNVRASAGRSGSGQPSGSSPGPSSVPSPSGTPSPTRASGNGTNAAPETAPGSVAEANRPRATPVALSAASSASRGITVRISRIERVQGKAILPGEVGGDALRLTVLATNRSNRSVLLPAAVVNLYYGADRTPAGPLREPGGRPFPQNVEPGQTVRGIFVFEVPRRPRVRLELEADLDHRLRIVTFSGVLPGKS